MTYLSFLEKKVLLQRLVIGLEEPVLIKGLGELSAKIDSGNGGYNVIHGTDFHQQGDILTFSTRDSSGNIKKISTKVIQQIQVNMGGGNIEVRPVVELDLKFAGEDYKKIPFSVSDRSSNTNPILISKGFVQNQLQALIDVGATNISGDGIEVVYGQSAINQGLISGFKKGWNAVSKVGNAISTGLKKVGNAVDAATKWGKGGNDVNVFAPLQFGLKVATGLTVGALGSVFGGIYSIAKVLTKTDTIVDKDKKQISGKLPNATAHRKLKQLQNKGVTVEGTIWQNYNKFNFKNAEIFPMLSFKGRVGDLQDGHVVSGMQARVQNWKQAIKTAQEAAKNSKSTNNKQQNNNQNTQNQNTTQEEQQYFNECFTFQVANALLTQNTKSFNSLMEDMNAMYYADKANQQQNTTQQNQQSSQQQTNNQQQNEQQTQQQNQQNSTEKPQKQYVSDQNTKNMEQTVTQFEQLNTFVLYFVPTRLSQKDNTKIDENSKEFVTKFLLEPKKLDKNLVKFFNHGKIDGNSAKPIVKDLAAAMRQAIEKDFKGSDRGDYYQGFFVLACGQPDKRQITLFDSAEQCAYKTLPKDESSQQQQQQRDIENDFYELYNRFNLLDSNTQKQMRKDNIYNYSTKIHSAIAKINQEREDAKSGNSQQITSGRVYQIAKEKVIDNGILQTAIIYDELSKTTSGQQILKALGINSTIKGSQIISSWQDFQEKVSSIENSNELIDNYVKQTQGQGEESDDSQQQNQTNQQEDKKKNTNQPQEETKPATQQNQPQQQTKPNENTNSPQQNQPQNNQKSTQEVGKQQGNNQEKNAQQSSQPKIQKQPTIRNKPTSQQVSQQQATDTQEENNNQTDEEVSTNEEPTQQTSQETQQQPTEKQSTTPQMDDLTRKLGGEDILKDQEEARKQEETNAEEQQISDTDTETNTDTQKQPSDTDNQDTSQQETQQATDSSSEQENSPHEEQPSDNQPEQSRSPKFDQVQKQIQKEKGLQDSTQETLDGETQNTDDNQQIIDDSKLGTEETSSNEEEHIIDDSNLSKQSNDGQNTTDVEDTTEQQTENDNTPSEQQTPSDQEQPTQEQIPQQQSIEGENQPENDGEQTPEQQVTTDGQTQQTNDGEVSIEQQPTQEQITDQQDVPNDEQTINDQQISDDGEETIADQQTSEDGQISEGQGTDDEEVSTEQQGQETQDTGDITIQQQPTQEQIQDQQLTNEEQASNENLQQTQNPEEYTDDIQIEQRPSSEESSTESSHNTSNQKTRIKSRAQMNAHARKNKKAHMKKGKRKGSGKSHQNEQQIIDRIITDSMQYKSGKMLIQSLKDIWKSLLS